jgi:hypothetical protein
MRENWMRMSKKAAGKRRGTLLHWWAPQSEGTIINFSMVRI